MYLVFDISKNNIITYYCVLIHSSKDYIKRIAEGSGNVDASGNFSIEVLRAALLHRYDLSLPNMNQENVRGLEITEMEGFVCNRESHWFAIRRIGPRFWNLNSTIDKPLPISHFRLAAEMQALQQEGYSVFCVTNGLPPPCTTQQQLEQGLPQFWWSEESLLRGGDGITQKQDPWQNLGKGMRLDGKANGSGASASATPTSGPAPVERDLGFLTEEEQIQLAMQQSIAEPATSSSSSNTVSEPQQIQVPTEPDASEANIVRIQFKCKGQRAIRRFRSTETIQHVYAFCKERFDTRNLSLRCGFPPQELDTNKDIKDLAGEMIHVVIV